ncbi:type III secretion system gatekeeper subunit SctW [Providencia vermicola]|uniref:Type III secretion system gatekeeper subunit SctW n=2 Tax=Providencia TaxID=586 RepID=A0AAI9I105_PROST|nr:MULTISPECIES: type III secretion system gatekeeper subunit SctW [Providencia]ELR5036284.1 type III secretion system gatekeeper subunit SctW [Providencia stuartii]ELX8380553.1 type III secretion system gatekeeper subunit SctW [Providencia stuartii]EMD5260090.1 type III secretion system gatekeeper subunit SctW [Providencia stuartii]MBG5920536.1 type III secretion system gatekeeper subunit SctW [Providencia stuartii]QIC14311.1 YopN family type III secretion system gatekeeper subunit [Providenc
MAIAPLGGGARMLGGAQEKSRSSKTGDDSDEVLRGQGVIDSSGEYASMSMLAASHVKRSSGKQDDTEDWMQFAERILDENADETILNVEGILNRQFMTPKELKAFLLRFFSDPSDLLMALAALINRGKLKQEQLEQLKKLEEQLHQEDIDRSTQAGVNIALIAKAFAQKIKQSAGNLRMLYREFLAYEGPVVYLYEQWVEEMESQERENIMRYLSRALACDLQALPLGDINMGEFGNYFIRVGRLRELQSLDHVFIQQFFQSNLFKHHRQFINEKFEKELSKLFTAGIRNHTNFNEGLLLFISSQLSMMSTDLRARFLQLLILAFATIPVSVFQSLEARDELINQLKDCMHYVMAQEELMMRNYFQREDF